MVTLTIQLHRILEDPREWDTSGGTMATGCGPRMLGFHIPAQFKGDIDEGSKPPEQTGDAEDEIHEVVL